MDAAETAGLPSFHKIWTPVNGQNGRSATREHRVSVKLVSDAAYPKSKARPVTGIPLIYGQNREPTSGLEPLSCSLRVINQALQGFA
jgi:hypothetical protein